MEEKKILKPLSTPVNAVLLETDEEKDPSRWILGATSKIIWKDLNELGIWLNNLPTEERQSNRFVDVWGCTNFGGLSSFEIQLDFQIANNLLSPRALAFLNGQNCANISYFDANGKVNFSDKYTYIKTGTRVGRGNYVWKTPDSARNVGLIPETMLPFGNPKTEAEFINPDQITPLMEQLAKEFRSVFTVEYEEIKVAGMLKSEARELFKHHMHHAPLLLAIACCPGYSTDNPIAMCNQTPIHLVVTPSIEEILTIIFDSYPEFIKTLGEDYLLPYVMKAVIYENKSNETTMKAIKADSPHVYLLNHDGSKKMMVLDMATLETLKVPITTVSQAELDAIETAGTMIWAEREILE